MQSQPSTATWNTSEDEVINGVEQKVTKFFQTAVVIDDARNMRWEVLIHRVQDYMVKIEPIWVHLDCVGATETARELDEWHGEEHHTNNIGELKAMHLFIRYLQYVASWQEARYETPSLTERDGDGP